MDRTDHSALSSFERTIDGLRLRCDVTPAPANADALTWVIRVFDTAGAERVTMQLPGVPVHPGETDDDAMERLYPIVADVLAPFRVASPSSPDAS